MARRGAVEEWLRDACVAMIDAASLLVPRPQRPDWKREWRAELWHRSQQGSAVPPDDALRLGRRRAPRSARRDLFLRSLGAFRHAVWLRSQEWKPDMLLQDLRYAVRSLRRAPTFTLMAVLTLGIGIGANTVVFNMLDSVLLRPYPYEAADELVTVFTFDTTAPEAVGSLSYPTYLDIRNADVFDDIAVWDWEPKNLRTEDETVYVGVGQVTSSLFRVLRVEPLVGRGFLPEEDIRGRGDVAILSEGIWRTRFGAEPGVVGRTAVLDGIPHVIVGVMPHEFGYPDEIEMWVPLGVTEETAPRTSNWLGALARMKSGLTIEQSDAALAPLAARLEAEYPDLNRDRGLAVQSLRENRVGELRPFFLTLFGAVGFLLLIVCANVANLLLARATSREREVSVRLALGASRTRLVRQLLTESLLLAFGGLALGFAVSRVSVDTIFAWIPLEIPVWIVVETNLSDVAFMASVAVVAAVLFGLVPALQATRPDLRGALADASGRASGSLRRKLTRNTLVVAEVAISLMLLVGAGLMARSFLQLASIDPGFESEGRLTATLQMPRAKYDDAATRTGFYQSMLDRLGALPGVESVGAISRMPLSGSSNTTWFMYEGQTGDEARANPNALINSVSPGYFDAIGIDVVRGRSFMDRDRGDAQPVVIVNDALADRYFPNGDALGKRLTMWPENWMEIVGVVASVRHFDLDTPPRLQMYVPYEQGTTTRLSLVLRTAGDPAALAAQVRNEVRAIDPDQALYNLRPLSAAVTESIWMWQFFSTLMWIFAGIAATVAAVGIYGVTAYSVSRRTQELGVRMALGAQRSHIQRMVIRQSMTIVGIGIAIGVVLALGQGVVLESILYDVSGTDPITFGGVVALIFAASLLAAWLPARRATRLDPVRALRDE